MVKEMELSGIGEEVSCWGEDRVPTRAGVAAYVLIFFVLIIIIIYFRFITAPLV